MLELSSQPHSLKPRILFLVPSDLDALRSKGVTRMILERDEGGFFERVVTVHPIALHGRTIDLNDVHRLHEFSAGRAFRPGPASFLHVCRLPVQLASIVRRITCIVREERIDIVRATDAYLMGALALVVARLTRRRFCVSLHADYDKRFALSPKGLVRRLLRRAAQRLPSLILPRADMVLPIRAHLAEWAARMGASPTAIHLIPHGIDLRPFEGQPTLDIRSVLGIDGSVQVVSFVGRLTKDNYIDDVMSVAASIAARREGFVLVLAGNDEDDDRLRRMVAESPQLAACVMMTGPLPYEQVVELRRTSAVALCLMAGFSLIEACAAACPIVTYDVEWHRDLVVDGVNGFVLPERDVEGVARAVEQLLDDPALANRMGARARELAFQQHDLRVTSQIKRECYRRLMA